ncbi:MAG TPA: PEP-CTERM sorting domain-containing protein [Thermoguttaceae bacterium]|nr:PEP-CTERM sorting domain-containing protein [Thermoguttaceae bacterium]
MILLCFWVISSGGWAEAGPYSAATADPTNPHDPPIAGFVDGQVNPIFVGWATGCVNYRPAPGVATQWKTPQKVLGPVTGSLGHVASLGDLNATQIAAYLADPVNNQGPGSITLTFDAPICNGSGADFAVFENGFMDPDGTIHAEFGYVEVSSDGARFARFPSVSLTDSSLGGEDTVDPTDIYNLIGKHTNNGGPCWGTPFDLDDLLDDSLVTTGAVDLDAIGYVRIVDIPGSGDFLDRAGRPIYDSWVTAGSGGVDPEAVGVLHAVPEPAGLALLLAGAMGVLVARGRRPAEPRKKKRGVVEKIENNHVSQLCHREYSMLTRIFAVLLCVGFVVAATSAEALVVHEGYDATMLYSASAGSTISGLDSRDGKLYFGEYTEIKSLDLSTLNAAVLGSVSGTIGCSFVAVKPDDGTVYVAHGNTYDPPCPYQTGYLDSTGVYCHQRDLEGVYDAAVNSAGELYLVANPDGDDPDFKGDGARIYEYDWSDGSVREVANVGGSTGGLAFDADDNLYYSSYDSDSVIRFEAADVAAGDLVADDATVAVDWDGPGFLAFDDAGDLFVGYYDPDTGSHVGLFDVETGIKLADVTDGGGKLVWANKTLYTFDTDWGTYTSTLYAIQSVPEPGAIILLGTLALGWGVLGGRRRA